MGQSTDATIAFGFDLGHELPEKLQEWADEHNDGSFEMCELIHYMAGGKPWSQNMTSKQSDAHFKEKREAEAAFPVDIVTHCYHEYPMYFLCIRGTENTATRGEPVSIQLDELNPAPDWKDKIKAFCDQWEIEYQEPNWHIFSYWG